MAANVNREANLRGGYGAATAASEIFLVSGELGRHPWRPLPGQGTWLGTRPDFAGVRRRSEASETFKQPVWAFPTPRKPSNNLFEPFRPLGNLQTTCLSLSDPSGRLRPPAKYAGYGLLRCSAGGREANRRRRAFPAHPAYLCRRLSGIWMRCELSDTMSDYYLLLRDYSNYYLYGITVWNRRASQRGKVDLV